MMISPETYVEMYLKGKSIEEIVKVIRSMKRELNACIREAESTPNPTEIRIIAPSAAVRVSVTKEYIDAAREYLHTLGYDYPLTKAEQRTKFFNDNFFNIETITVEYGGCRSIRERRKITHDGEKIVVVEWDKLFRSKREMNMTWTGLLEDLSMVNMGEWKTYYDDPEVCDGTQWEIIIEYNNGIRAKRFSGSNKYPFSFERFMHIMEMEMR